MKIRYKKAWVNLFILVVFAALLIYGTFRFAPQITRHIKTPQEFRLYLLAYGDKSIWVFMLFQAVQVILAVIPGELFQFAGGYIFGAFFGTLYSIIGIMAGSVIAFILARLAGYSLIKKLVSADTLKRFDFLMNSKKAEVVTFILFLIPGLPKDMLVYIAGCSPVHPLRFFSAVTIARLPAIWVSSYVGANLQTKQYTTVVIVSIVTCLLLLVVLLYKDKWIKKLKRLS